MIIISGNETTNPKIPGKILVGFECIRLVSIAEIRNHTEDINQNLLFYLEILGIENSFRRFLS